MRLRLVPADTNIDFFKAPWLTLGASGLAMLASIILFLTVGLNYGIDFRGGTTIRVDSKEPVDVALYRAALEPLDLGDVTISRIVDPTQPDKNVAQVRIQAQEGSEAVTNEVIRKVKHALASTTDSEIHLDVKMAGTDYRLPEGAEPIPGGFRLTFPPGTSLEQIEAERERIDGEYGEIVTADILYEKMSFPQVESVGPKVSGELVWTAIEAVVAAIAAVLFYIWLRFEWQFSLGAVAALIHDVVLTIGVFSILQIKFDLAIIAAILTIVGYSLNDTVVVFDRVRENLRKYKVKPLKDVLNLSINETLSRTLMTSLTTLLALVSLFVLGGDVIRGFVFAMIWGIVVGTYSSVFVASAILLWLGVKRDWEKPDAAAGTQFANVDS